MTVYQVNARRSGDWWALEVPDLPGVFSQAKRLDKADEAAREAIAVLLDVDPQTVEVNVEPQLTDEEDAVVREARQARAEARRAEEAAARADRRAAALLARRRGLSQRDTGDLLGLSFQRVSQLLNSTPRDKAKPAKGKKARQRTDA